MIREENGTTFGGGIYPKSRRMTIEKNTRAAWAMRRVTSDGARSRTEARVIREARAEWARLWGDLPWGLTTIVVTHMTAQVTAEVRVEP